MELDVVDRVGPIVGDAPGRAEAHREAALVGCHPRLSQTLSAHTCASMLPPNALPMIPNFSAPEMPSVFGEPS